MMKPLSLLRKALVFGSFTLGIISTLYGFLFNHQMAMALGQVALLAFLILFVLLILPYWKSEPGVNPEMS